MNFLYDWFSSNIPIWDLILKKYKNKEKLLFLEIGCFEGRATLWLVENILTHPSSKIVVIDTFQGGQDQSDFGVQTDHLLAKFENNLKDYISKDLNKNKVIIKKGFSGKVLKSLSDKFDFVYIDGSHIAKDVLEDAVLSWNLLNDNGIMVFDDYNWDLYKDETKNPKLAINCFLRIYKGWYKILHAEYQIIIQKKSKKNYSDRTIKIIYEKIFLADFLSKQDVIKSDALNREIINSKFYKLWKIYCSLKNFLMIFK